MICGGGSDAAAKTVVKPDNTTDASTTTRMTVDGAGRIDIPIGSSVPSGFMPMIGPIVKVATIGAAIGCGRKSPA